jgi:predicted RNA-binding Zn-ribbon protein involved in translation (DUF1610 family)
MITRTRPWFSFSAPNSTVVRCSACGQSIDLGPMADHHPARCPHCGVESAFLNWNARIVQVVPQHAPPAFIAALRWAQQNLDELEYVELICALEELAEGTSRADGPPNR